MVMCWALDCKHYNVRDTCKFFRFPKSPKKRSKWKSLLRRDVEPGPGAYVCSCHFREGKKENGPEIFQHNIVKRLQFDYTSPEKKKRKRKIKESPRKSLTNLTATLETEVGTNDMLPTTEVLDEPSVFSKVEVDLPKKKIAELNKVIEVSTKFSYENIQNSNELVQLYTGLPTSKIFEALYTLIKDIKINYYYSWNVEKIPKIDQLLLTLMKLRLNTPHLDIAFRFNISQGAVSNIVLTFLHVIYEILYEQFMVVLPSRHKNKTCLPSCFSNFTNCRAILDCTEIYTVVTRNSMKVQKLTYSSYKHRNTFKGLIGVSPNGVVTFVSDLFVGSTSDKKVVLKSGLLDLLEVGDMLLADKGFLIQDILPYGVSLNIPPFLRTPQFTPDQIKCTENIARARIHVERAIRRMKCYRILAMLPETLCPFGDLVFKSVAALTNLQYPLIKEVGDLFTMDND